MRLVIDLQGAQGVSRLRGIGRYSRELALAMARAPGRHDLAVALNGALPCDELSAAFRDVLPAEAVRVWQGVSAIGELEAANAGRRAGAEALRAQLLASMRPDIVHVASLFEGLEDAVVSCWPAALHRPPTVATCYDLIPLIQRADYLDTAWRGPVSRWYFRRLQEMSLCDGLLAISDSSRREAIEHLGCREDSVFNIRAGISAHFAPRPLHGEARAAFLRRLGLREGFVLFVGAGDRRKNEAGLIRAYALLPPELRAAHQLVIVGKTSPEELGRAATQAGLRAQDLLLLPFVEEDDLPRLYSACHLFVLPSLHEGFGLPAAEAMACGAPTIASNATSLPEVVGRADALFDPLRPDSIAGRMQAVLTDAGFRSALAEHGLRQAASFTWAESAQRAWSALEAVQERLGGRPRAAGAMVRRRPSLAFVSPLPPDESGIADFARDLVCALARHYDVTLVCDRGTTDEERLAAAFPVLDPDSFLAAADRFDRVLYQVGNSQFHARQVLELLPAVPGVVTLHDAYLSGLALWNAQQAGGRFRLRLDLLRSHGWPAVVLAAADPNAALARYPCSLPVLRAALATVQHSQHAKDITARHYAPAVAQDIAVIPLLHGVPPPLARTAARRQLGVPEDAFLVCSFGIVAPRKLPDRILAAWPAVAAADPAARLVFVGEALSEAEAMLSAAPPGAAVKVTGRVSAADYRVWLAAADVAVQLRAGSRGESSGAVADCLAAGLPTIVNAEGSLAELPEEATHRLPRDPEPAAIAAALLVLRDPERRVELAEAALRHVRQDLAPQRIAERYRDVIEAAYAEGPAAAAAMATRWAAAGGVLGGDDIAPVASAIAHSFPTAGPPQLLLDAGLLEQDLADWVRAALAGHDEGVRVHLVQGDGTGLRTAPSLACRLLDLDDTGLVAEAVMPGPGDAVLLAAERSALAAADLATVRRAGAAVIALGAAAPSVETHAQVFRTRREAAAATAADPDAPCLDELSPAAAVAALLALGAAASAR